MLEAKLPIKTNSCPELRHLSPVWIHIYKDSFTSKSASSQLSESAAQLSEATEKYSSTNLKYQGQKKVPAFTPCFSAVIQICNRKDWSSYGVYCIMISYCVPVLILSHTTWPTNCMYYIVLIPFVQEQEWRDTHTDNIYFYFTDKISSKWYEIRSSYCSVTNHCPVFFIYSACEFELTPTTSWYLQFTHWLSAPPPVVQFLSGAQAEGGIKHRVMHGVPHNPVGLWVKTLWRYPTGQ